MVKLICEWPKCFNYNGYETFIIKGDIKFDNDENSANYGCIVFNSMGRGYAIPFSRIIKIENIEDE